MPKRIKEDHEQFRGIISGRTNRELKRLIKTGQITRLKPKGGKVTLTIPSIDIPHFVFGDNREGVGRGPGKEGDIVGRDPQQGKGKGGNKAGDQPGEGIQITVDLEYVLKLMGDDLQLPPMRPKPDQIYEEVKIKYNDISKVGPESLRHTRRTMREALKRLAASQKLDDLHMVPGSDIPMRLITPISADKRYRQYNEIRIPTSNAVIFFARDCSGSMDDFRCDIVSDMSWWIDCWIRQFYKRTSRCYFIHDTRAQEVNEEEFYKYRYGGGTQCSCVFEAIAEQLENRFPPSAYNVYIFYFSDGDNYGGDNERLEKIVREKLGPNIINMIGFAQIFPWSNEDSLKSHIDRCLKTGKLDKDFIRTTQIGNQEKNDSTFGFSNWGYRPTISDEDLDEQKLRAIRELLKERESYAYATGA